MTKNEQIDRLTELAQVNLNEMRKAYWQGYADGFDRATKLVSTTLFREKSAMVLTPEAYKQEAKGDAE